MSKFDISTKKELYVSAQALVSCAHFKAGEFVSIKFSCFDRKGIAWYDIYETEHGTLPYIVSYPEHHLTRFCL